MHWVLDFPTKGAVEFTNCENFFQHTTQNTQILGNFVLEWLYNLLIIFEYAEVL